MIGNRCSAKKSKTEIQESQTKRHHHHRGRRLLYAYMTCELWIVRLMMR